MRDIQTPKIREMTYRVNLTIDTCNGRKVYPNFKYSPEFPTTMQAVIELEVVFPGLISVEFL